MAGTTTIPGRSAKDVAVRANRSRLRLAAWDLGIVNERTRVLEKWLDALSPLARENAELLVRQQEIDGRAAERTLGYADEQHDADIEELRGFLHPVHFDREDDVWMFRAARSRTLAKRSGSNRR